MHKLLFKSIKFYLFYGVNVKKNVGYVQIHSTHRVVKKYPDNKLLLG